MNEFSGFSGRSTIDQTYGMLFFCLFFITRTNCKGRLPKRSHCRTRITKQILIGTCLLSPKVGAISFFYIFFIVLYYNGIAAKICCRQRKIKVNTKQQIAERNNKIRNALKLTHE